MASSPRRKKHAEMGNFSYPITIFSPNGSRFEQLTPLVDTGSLFTWLPATVLERLGVPRGKEESFRMANGQDLERATADVTIEIDGVRHVTAVVFGESGDLVLLGSLALERFLLMPDPVNRRLVPIVALAG